MSDGGGDSGARPRRGAPLRFFDRTVSGMNALGSAWILVMMLLIDTDAFSRTLFDAPIVGVVEIVQISIVAIVFLQLADSLRGGVLTRSDGLFNLVMRRNPRAGRGMGMVTHLLGAVFMGLVLYGSWPLMVEAWVRHHYIGIEGVFTAPMWPIRVVIVVACAVTMVQFLIFTVRYLRSRDSGAPPAAGRG